MFNYFGIALVCVSGKLMCCRIKKGFALSEAVIAMVVVSMLAVAMIDLVNSYYVFTSFSLTDDRINKIEEALAVYVKTAGRLPCPASLTAKLQDAAFGQSANCATVTDGNGFAVSGSGGVKLVKGAVPVRELSLPQNYAYDKWGRKFGYAMIADLAISKKNFLQYTATAKNNTVITIQNVSSQIVSSQQSEQPAYVLLSYGKAGRGAYNANGVVGVACDANYLEALNCSSGNTFIYNSTVQLGGPSSYFDDIVYWNTYSSLLNMYYQNNTYLNKKIDDTANFEVTKVVDSIIGDTDFSSITKTPGAYLLAKCNSPDIVPHLILKSGDAAPAKQCIVVQHKDVPDDKLILVYNLEENETVFVRNEGLFRVSNGELLFALDLHVVHNIDEVKYIIDKAGAPNKLAKRGLHKQGGTMQNVDILYVDAKGQAYGTPSPFVGAIFLFGRNIMKYAPESGSNDVFVWDIITNW